MNKKEQLLYFKSKLNKGCCSSLKKERNEDFNDFMELFKNHPEYDTKLKNVVDLCIIHNKKNKKYFEINLIKQDGSLEDISYLRCINKVPKNYNLNSALRYTIEPQISEYRTKNRLICEICKSSENIHIDHIENFSDLVNNFLNTRKDIPIDFDDNEYNGCKFQDKDIQFKIDWYEYHKKNAKLRCLCAKCNLTQPKRKKAN